MHHFKQYNNTTLFCNAFFVPAVNLNNVLQMLVQIINTWVGTGGRGGRKLTSVRRRGTGSCPPLSLPVTFPRSQELGWVLPFTARLSSALVPGPIQTTDGQNLNSSIASSHGTEYSSFPDPRALWCSWAPVCSTAENWALFRFSLPCHPQSSPGTSASDTQSSSQYSDSWVWSFLLMTLAILNPMCYPSGISLPWSTFLPGTCLSLGSLNVHRCPTHSPSLGTTLCLPAQLLLHIGWVCLPAPKLL